MNTSVKTNTIKIKLTDYVVDRNRERKDCYLLSCFHGTRSTVIRT